MKVEEIALEIFLRKLPSTTLALAGKQYLSNVAESYEVAKMFKENIDALIKFDEGIEKGTDDDK